LFIKRETALSEYLVVLVALYEKFIAIAIDYMKRTKSERKNRVEQVSLQA
jgi:hypothetical protein